ncbi:DUF4132 domain-containing protein [Actinomadura violacea]|uniref:DUF4132 domain-containing protein n=1 Tax=Actinomadura violacea TaxID=2819934 RepID=A0ABS3RK98_9ACTN|nr:DUF4132 domain-containing protein [Actinomadura violacea]MBO2457160.1 DUF4132 domain-containing protein [Actinomadura violacea]
MEDHLPDEDALVLPEAWRRALHPRRGGAPGPKVNVDGSAPGTAQAYLKRAAGTVDPFLEVGHGDPALVDAARRHLGGDPDPRGAAAVAAVTVAGVGPYYRREVHEAFADGWVTEHGLGFAAGALVELSRTVASYLRSAGRSGYRVGAVHGPDDHLGGAAPEVLRRVRALLAAASDEEYAAAVERLAGHRAGPGTKWVASYLVPTREDWVDECCALPVPVRPEGHWLVLATLGNASQLSAAPALSADTSSRAVLATMADGIGAGILGFLLTAVDGKSSLRLDERRHIFETIAVLPSDEAFQALIDRIDREHARAALVAAARRFPARALRLLARAGAADLLGAHLDANADLVAGVLPGLPDDEAALVRSVAAESTRVAAAEPHEVPRVLADPPWLRVRRPVVPGLRAPEPRVVWRDGERQAWLDADPDVPLPDGTDWDAYAEVYGTRYQKIRPLQLIVHGPEELVRPLLAEFTDYSEYSPAPWVRRLVARYGIDALPVAIRTSVEGPQTNAVHLTPFLDAGVVELMAEWSTKPAKFQEPARRWLDRNGLDAVGPLVPAALGEKGKQRAQAETALRHVTDAHGLAGAVAAARDAHGDEAAAAVEELLSAPPAGTGLERPAKVAGWIDPAALPQVRLRGRDRALPVDAVRRLLELLTLPTSTGMDEVKGRCEPDSVAAFGRALFRQWREAGAPSKDGWALTQLGRTGDDETVRLLTPVIRAWPGEGGHKNAVRGLGVLAEIGSDVALMHLHGIAQKVKFKGLKAEAQARIREVADRLGLTTEQLADRLVPTFGLDAAGTMVLDYGPRRFVVGLDEHLAPFVSDEDGKRRKALPKPGAKDDPELAPAAHQRFAALKKDLRAAASGQLVRLEQAMVTQREWTPAEFGEFIVRHPLVRHIARRLVWIAQDGGTAAAFRVAEDGTFADADDDAFALPEKARVRIAHPLHLDGALEAWSEVFADYEIIQPFPQLNRPVRALTEEERGGGRLERFEGLKVPFGKVLGLVKRGWARGEPQDAGGERWISRRVAADRYVVIDLDPGISVGAVDATGDHQTLDYVWFATKPADYSPRKGTPLKFGDLDPVMASEILADLDTLAEAAV